MAAPTLTAAAPGGANEESPLSRNFKSDNVTPACEPIMTAINAANAGSAASYGGDDLTLRLQSVASQVFGREVAIFPVTTGTAANSLALSQITPPFGAMYCHQAAHIVTDECGAPEFFTGGAKMIGFAAPDGKITPEQCDERDCLCRGHGRASCGAGSGELESGHRVGNGVRIGRSVRAQRSCSAAGAGVHMDGARFANALVHLDCTPAAATWQSGIDVLSLGATKNGALCAEAVVFFDPDRARDFERRRKRAGHLWSKLRFVSAQLLAYFEHGLWLENARHANSMASALGEGLRSIPGARLLQAVDANEIFVALPEAVVTALESQGFGFYRWPLCDAPAGVAIRLVTSYATLRTQVEEFVAAARQCG